MSEFTCEVVRVAIEPHPNADAIELAKVGGYPTEHGYQKWDGKQWLSYCGTPERAATMVSRSAYQSPRWRGFKHKQVAK